MTIDNDIGLLERTLAALGRPAWEVTPEDIDRVVGDLAVKGRATSTRRECVQIFKGFHRFLQARKAAEMEAAFGVKLVCPVDEFNASRHVGDDSPALTPPPTPERVAEFFDFMKQRIATARKYGPAARDYVRQAPRPLRQREPTPPGRGRVGCPCTSSTRRRWPRCCPIKPCTPSSVAPRTPHTPCTRGYQRMTAGSPDPAVTWLNWVIRLRDESCLTGTVQATIIPDRHGIVAEIAWVVGTPWQGRGIATEAARAFVDWLSQQSVHAVIAHIHPEHGASGAVATAAGLTPTDEQHDGETR